MMAVPYWQRYLPFFHRMGLPAAFAGPETETMIAHNQTISIERYPVAQAAVKVIIVHGAGGYARLFLPYALMLQQAGFEVLIPDLPGYGKSKPCSAKNIDFKVWEQVLLDVVRREHAVNQQPCVLLGCSIGGFLAYQVACQSPEVYGLIVTLLANPQDNATKRAFARRPWLGRVAPWLLLYLGPLSNLKVPLRWLANMAAITNDPELTQMFLADTDGGGNHLPLGFVRSLLRSRPAVAPEQFDRCPVLMIHPAVDRWTPPVISKLMFDQLRVDKKWVWLENCGHYPAEQPGLATMQAEVLSFLQAIQVGAGPFADKQHSV